MILDNIGGTIIYKLVDCPWFSIAMFDYQRVRMTWALNKYEVYWDSTNPFPAHIKGSLSGDLMG